MISRIGTPDPRSAACTAAVGSRQLAWWIAPITSGVAIGTTCPWLSHRGVRLGECVVPAADRAAFVREVRIEVRVGAGSATGDFDAICEARARVEVGQVDEVNVASVDEHECGRPVRAPGAERARDPRPPGEPNERGARDIQRLEQDVSDPRERRGAEPFRVHSRRASMPRRVGSDHAKPELTGEDRADLVRVQAGAAASVPVEDRWRVDVAPLVDEEPCRLRLDLERPHGTIMDGRGAAASRGRRAPAAVSGHVRLRVSSHSKQIQALASGAHGSQILTHDLVGDRDAADTCFRSRRRLPHPPDDHAG